MTSLNLSPAISKIEYLADGQPISDVIILGSQRKSITIRITLSGLNHMYNQAEYFHTKTKDFTHFKVYITNFTQRGMKDTAIHNLKEYEFTEKIMLEGTYVMEYDLGEFYTPYYFIDSKGHEFKYDLVENIMFVKMFSAPYIEVLHLNTFDEKLDAVLDHADYTFKVPMVSYGEPNE